MTRETDAARAGSLATVEYEHLLTSSDLYLSPSYRRVSSSSTEQHIALSETDDIWAVFRLVDHTEPADQFMRIDQVTCRLSEERERATLPSLTVSPRAATDTHLLAPEGTTTSTLLGALHSLEEHARRLGMRSVSFPYVLNSRRELTSALEASGFSALAADDAFVLDANVANFEEYLQRLSAKRRNKVRRERLMLREAGVTIRSLSIRDVDLGQLARLECNLQAKYGRYRNYNDVLAAMESLGGAMAEHIVIHTAWLGGVLLGFIYVVHWMGAAYPRWVGFDYDAKGSLPVYFELVYYTNLEDCISRGSARINLSIGSSDAKLSRGSWTLSQTTFWKEL